MKHRTTITLALALAACVMCAPSLPHVAAVAALTLDPPECQYVIVYEDGSYQGFTTESEMWAAVATSEVPVAWSGTVAMAMYWGMLDGLRPRLMTCIISGGAEG
jgi:hypothetical protein